MGGSLVQFFLEAAEQVVPDEEHADVVLVQVDIVLRVVDAVVGGRLDPAVENAHAADMPRVRPELVEELRHADQQKDGEWHAAERHRHIENPVGERAGAGLPQGRGEVELLALVMHHVRCPEQAHGVAEAVMPVVAEIVEDEGEYPGGPAVRGQAHGGAVGQHPLVSIEAEETEEDAHAGADDAATQAVQRVGEAVVAGAAEPVDDEFEGDERQEDRDRETYRAAIRAVHVDIVAQTSRLAPPTTIEDMEAGQADIAMELRERLEAQRTAFRKSPPGRPERMDALRRLEQALLKHKDDIIAAISQDFGGRPGEETVTLELFPVLNEIRHALRHLKRWMEPRRAPVEWQFWPGRARVIYQPRGVVGIIAPWNYPVFLSLGPLVGAMAAGNHVMVKPSELAPATARLVQSMMAELYSPEYVSVIPGEPDVAAAFAGLRFDHLLFTGSARVGKLVMKAASENLTPVTLELGGKSPALVHASYPVREAATKIMAGKLFNAGQTCVAPDYVLLPHERKKEFLSEMRAAVGKLYPKLAGNRDYTRILSARHYQRLTGLVEDARRKGAEVLEVNPARRSAARRTACSRRLWF